MPARQFQPKRPFNVSPVIHPTIPLQHLEYLCDTLDSISQQLDSDLVAFPLPFLEHCVNA